MCAETASGATTEESPKIIRIFRILLPTMFPMVISAFPLTAAVMLTAASGALVPMATMVSPMTSCDMPSRPAISEAPSTKRSAPFTRSTNPRTNNNSENTIPMPTCPPFFQKPAAFVRFLQTEKISGLQKSEHFTASSMCNKVSLLIHRAGFPGPRRRNRIDGKVNTEHVHASYSLYQGQFTTGKSILSMRSFPGFL